ncbi:uncharacterized protein EKO05_0007184 [Ascochyta rabiei]|uniref:uncharacterized protein n=1 Tax=Didymella rabiei TaxID=5454 RepID=UPI0022058690|nr:uncharacterized protein EKO05_0007184 [Ascochyta rabiei]UPX16799.1 hypothetical protein EKO05_0007184 [Ascochyta rabiei]
MPPPKRMSDILASSSIDAPIAPSPSHARPYSSDGPTLPLLSASTLQVAPNDRKRKRAPASEVQGREEGGRGGAEKAAERRGTHHPALYKPWTLLPPKLSKVVEEMQRGRENGASGVEVVVFSKNQNVRSGVNRLKKHISSAPRRGDADTADLLAVSAQGAAVVKLVGIVDVVRRVVGAAAAAPTTEKEGEEEGEEKKEREVVKWYTYPVLSHVLVPAGPRRRGGLADGQPGYEPDTIDVLDPMDVDEDGDIDSHINNPATKTTDSGTAQSSTRAGDGEHAGAADGNRREDGGADEKQKTIPVLTIWIARSRIPSFADAFGEGQVLVC